MTSPFTPVQQGSTDPDDYFDPMKQQGHLLIVRVHAEAQGVVTKHCPDGWQRRPGRDPRINNALQVSIVDLNWQDPNGTLGKIYPEAMIYTGTLVGGLKRAVGETKLLIWKQKDFPKDAYGNPDKTNPYDIMDMSGNEQAVAAANTFLQAHPEFMTIPAPAPYQAPAPPPQQPPPPPQQWQQPAQPPASWNTAAPPQQYQDRKSTRLNSSHIQKSRMPSSA